MPCSLLGRPHLSADLLNQQVRAAFEPHPDDQRIIDGKIQQQWSQRLLSDIADRKVDTVVVYKVGRPTRSLRDFAKIVDL